MWHFRLRRKRLKLKACARNTAASVCPSLGLLPGGASGTLVLPLVPIFPIPSSPDAACDRCVRGEPCDPAAPAPDVGTGVYIRRARRVPQNGSGFHAAPNPWLPLLLGVSFLHASTAVGYGK